jgi:hypothetical protein
VSAIFSAMNSLLSAGVAGRTEMADGEPDRNVDRSDDLGVVMTVEMGLNPRNQFLGGRLEYRARRRDQRQHTGVHMSIIGRPTDRGVQQRAEGRKGAVPSGQNRAKLSEQVLAGSIPALATSTQCI